MGFLQGARYWTVALGKKKYWIMPTIDRHGEGETIPLKTIELLGLF